MLLSTMLGSEKQVTEPERAGKKDVKFPGKQKWKNGQIFYILKYKEMATLSQGSLISLLKMSTQKKDQDQRKLPQLLHSSGRAINLMNDV